MYTLFLHCSDRFIIKKTIQNRISDLTWMSPVPSCSSAPMIPRDLASELQRASESDKNPGHSFIKGTSSECSAGPKAILSHSSEIGDKLDEDKSDTSHVKVVNVSQKTSPVKVPEEVPAEVAAKVVEDLFAFLDQKGNKKLALAVKTCLTERKDTAGSSTGKTFKFHQIQATNTLVLQHLKVYRFKNDFTMRKIYILK